MIEQTTSLQYRGKGGDGGSSGLFGFSAQKINTAIASMSYVTGAHSFKVGFTDTWALDRERVAHQHLGDAVPLHQRRADAVHDVRAGRERHGLAR